MDENSKWFTVREFRGVRSAGSVLLPIVLNFQAQLRYGLPQEF